MRDFKFKVTRSDFHYILKINVTKNDDGTLSLSQAPYIEQCAKRFGVVGHAHKGEDPPARPLRGPLARWEMAVCTF